MSTRENSGRRDYNSGNRQGRGHYGNRGRSGAGKSVRRFLTGLMVCPPRKRNGRIRLLRLGEAAHLALFPVLLIYCEIILHLKNKTGLFANLLYPLLFGLALGLLLNIPTTLFPKKINRIITALLMAVIEIMYTVECMIYNSYQVYMTFSSIMTGAGGVMTGYTGDMLHAIFGGFITIILFMWPVVIYLIFGKKRLRAIQYRPLMSALMLGGSLVFFVFACILASHGKMADRYKDQYEFSAATATFGLPTSLRLNIVRSHSDTHDFHTVSGNLADAATETASDGTESEDTEAAYEVVNYGVNEMDIDFDTLLAGNTDEDVINVTNYVESLTPSNQNKYTGLFEGKNLIIITAEAFSYAVISEKLTPTLYRMQQNGFNFTEYYQPTWGGSTITGEYSQLLGLVPTNGVDTIYETIGHNLYFTMGNQLQRLGYFNAAFHNKYYDYYDRQTTHNNFGYGLWLGQNNGLEDICGEDLPSDADMMTKTFEWYKDQQPFSIYYLTVNGHCAYESDSPLVTKYLDYVKANVDRDYEDKTLYYLCYQCALEEALTELIEALEEAGIANDTVIELTADHYPYGLAQSETWQNSRSYVTDLYGLEHVEHPWKQDRNALLIWSECLENEYKDYACEIDDPVYSLDILPTLSNLFGLEYDSRLLPGRDVFSDTEPLVVWNNGHWVTREGKYDANECEFYPNEGVTVSDDYVENINDIVSDKIYLSKKILSLDYYGLLFGKDTDISSNAKSLLDPYFEDNNPSTSQ